MNGLIQRSGWSLKYSLVLPVLIRLEQIRPVGRLFRSAYRAGALGVARSLRQPGVRNIYLRRGIAKNEFMPFLSDIDLLVITDSGAVKQTVEARLRNLRRLMPMLEPQSPVVTLEEFHDWQQPAMFCENRSFLYRILEARGTWETLYSRDNDNPLDSTREFGRNEIIAVVFSEILFWHRIVVTEYTAYRLGSRQASGLARRKRFCWIFMKATTELHNFLQALQNDSEPLYTRRQIIESVIGESGNSRWTRLFRNNLSIINDHFDLRQSEEYLFEAISYLSSVYREFDNLMSGMLAEDVEFMDWVQTHCCIAGSPAVPDFHPVDLDGLTDLRLPDDVNLAAVCVAPLPESNHRHKVLVVFVLRSTAQASLATIENALGVITDHLLLQGIRRDQLDIDLVDYSGFRCFGIARQTGKNVILAPHEDRVSLLPPLHARMFAARSRNARVQTTSSGATVT
jgi:predicted nucleotidyltransferase